ncbi:TPA: hypothetical protein ACOEAT_001445 [Enterobacter ludwigii]
MFLNWNEYRTSLLATVGKFARLQPEFMKGLQQMDNASPSGATRGYAL